MTRISISFGVHCKVIEGMNSLSEMSEFRRACREAVAPNKRSTYFVRVNPYSSSRVTKASLCFPDRNLTLALTV